MSASDYLSTADSLGDMAMKTDNAEREAFLAAMAQVNAIQAVAAALDRLADAVEATR